MLPACTSVRGSGEVISRKFETDTFSEVRLDGIGNVILLEAAQPSVSVTTDDNLINKVSFEVDNHVLVLKTQNIVNPTALAITIHYPDLNNLWVDGVMTVELSELDQESLSICAKGGEINGSGLVKQLAVEAEETTEVSLEALEAENAEVMAKDASSVRVRVTDSLRATTMDVAAISFLGDPDLQANSEKGGSIEPLSH